jgi:hypothetical protein
VFHTATIWVNGELAGEHVRKGYTAFVLDKFERELLVLVTETQRE